MFVFLIWHILSILRDKLPSHKEARADTSLWRHGCVTKGCVRANTESDTHLLKLLCINTPTFIITYFCLTSFNRNSHTDTKQMQWVNQNMFKRKSWITGVSLMKICPMQAQHCSTDTQNLCTCTYADSITIRRPKKKILYCFKHMQG